MFDFAHKIDVASKATLIKHATIMCADIMTAFFSYYQRKSDRLIHPNGMFAGPPKYR